MKFLGCPTTCAAGIEPDDTPPGTPSQPDSKTLLPRPQRPRNRGFLNVFRVLAGIPFRTPRKNVPVSQPSRIPIRVYPGSPRKFGQRKTPPAKPKRVKKTSQETSFLTTIDEEANGESSNYQVYSMTGTGSCMLRRRTMLGGADSSDGLVMAFHVGAVYGNMCTADVRIWNYIRGVVKRNRGLARCCTIVKRKGGPLEQEKVQAGAASRLPIVSPLSCSRSDLVQIFFWTTRGQP